MPYTSNPGGLFNSGVFPDSRPRVDVGQILDAVGSGVGSIIHQTMLRKQAQNELALRQQQVGIEQQRAATEAANQNRDYALRQDKQRQDFIVAGGIPAHTDTTQVGAQAAITPLNPTAPSQSPIRRAMAPSGSAGATTSADIPPVEATSSGAPAAPMGGSVTAYTPTNVDVPESFDPTRSSAYARGVAEQQLRNEGYVTRDQARAEQQQQLQAVRLAAQQKGREYAATAAKQLAQWKQAHPMPKSSVARTMTGNAQEALNEKIAGGYLEQHNGNLQDAVDDLENTPEGKALADQGVTRAHLLAAYGKSNAASTASALRLQAGAAGLDPNEAVDAVSTTRKLVGASGKKAPAGDTPGNVTLPAAPAAPAAAPAAAAPSSAGAQPAAPVADDFTDDEVAEAMKAGKTTPDDVRKYITTQRTKKKVKP